MTGGADQASISRTQVSLADGTGENSETREVEDGFHSHGCSECFPLVPFPQTLFLLDRGVGMVRMIVTGPRAVGEGLFNVLVGARAREL